MRKFADFIVNHRKAISVLFVVLIVYCIWGMSQVEVEYDITTYLSEETDTRKALDIMDEEFTTYGTATIMLRNVTFDEAEALHTAISELEGVLYTEQRMRLEQAEIISYSNIQAVMSLQSMKIRAERLLGLGLRLRVAWDS